MISIKKILCLEILEMSLLKLKERKVIPLSKAMCPTLQPHPQQSIPLDKDKKKHKNKSQKDK